MHTTHIAIMAKAPVAGLAKTRLIPALGAQGAAALAARLLQHAVEQAVAVQRGPVTLWAAPDCTHPAFVQAKQRHGVLLRPQPQGDLGVRMAHVFLQTPGPVLLMGTDLPGITSATVLEALVLLHRHDAVLVPALDGGYGLIGLHRCVPSLFTNMPWSTPRVLALTRERLAAAGLRHAELPAVADIDEPADLVHLPATWTPLGQGANGVDNHTLPTAAPVCSMPDTPEPIESMEPPALPPSAVPVAEVPAAVSSVPSVPELSPAACAAALAERFPALFTAGQPLPIKLRIQADIQARAPGVFSKRSLSIFLHRHTTSTPYIRALLAASTRFDLDGQAAGEIADEHRAAATEELERRRQIVVARRAAERAAERAALGQTQRAAQQQNAAAVESAQAPPQPAPRPARHSRPPQAQQQQHRRPEIQHAARHAKPRPAAPPAAPHPPQDPARRERQALLRAFESSSLSKANFMVLKRLSEADLDAQLAQARQERDQGDHRDGRG